jgi:hypothetical protein
MPAPSAHAGQVYELTSSIRQHRSKIVTELALDPKPMAADRTWGQELNF